MQSERFKVRFWGTRGSIPAPGPGTVRYGGNTSCVEVRCGKELIILDAGTGIRDLGTEILKEMPVRASIIFSHIHWDHIQGMPFFRPAYKRGNEFRLYGSKSWSTKLEYALKWQMQSPNFPVTIEQMNAIGAKMEYIDAPAEFTIGDADQISIKSVELHHPDNALGFRIDYCGKSLIYATDTENVKEPNERLVELACEADLLIHDAQYTMEEYYGLDGNSKINRGHSTPESAVAVALAAKVKKLVLFHHDPYHDDRFIDRMLKCASDIFPDTIAASEGMVIEL